MSPRERPWRDVPRHLIAGFAASLMCLIAAHWLVPPPAAQARALPAPPSLATLRVASLGDEVALGKVLMLWLQAHDNQPGVSIPFRALDYSRVIGWLTRISRLDPDASYPLLAASRLYAEVPDAARQRAMLDFVQQEFRRAPNRYWPWLAHGTLIAKHRLGDTPLARRFAKDLRERATGPSVPGWVTQMELLIAAESDELDGARVLLGGLIESGQIRDPRELDFLRRRLENLEQDAARKHGRLTKP